MSTNQTDNQRPLPRSNILQSQGRPPARSISQIYSQSSQVPTRKVSFDGSSLRSVEPIAKRPKIEYEGLLQRTRDRGFADIIESELQRGVSSTELKGHEIPCRLPPFPSRPGTLVQKTQSPVHQYFQNREPVSSKPYVLDIPKGAPKYADKRKFTLSKNAVDD